MTDGQSDMFSGPTWFVHINPGFRWKVQNRAGETLMPVGFDGEFTRNSVSLSA